MIVGGALLGVAAYRVQVNDILSPADRAAAQVAIGWTFIAVGVIVCIRRAGNMLGPLLLAAGALWLARQLRYADNAALFTAVLPARRPLLRARRARGARLPDRAESAARLDRGIMFAGYATALALPVRGAAALRRQVAPGADAAVPARQPDRDR